MKLHQRLFGAFFAVLLFAGQAFAAEQSSYQPPTAGPMSMATFVATYLNPALRALATCNWGTTAPANGPGSAVAAQQCWWDTSGTPYVLKWYIGGQWVAVANVNASTHITTIPGLIIGTDVQAFDADLAALAANSTDGLWAHTGSGTGAARTLTPPAAGFTITNPAGVAGNPTFVLANDLAAIEGLSCTGVAIRSATDTWLCRTIGGTANEISVANGDGVAGAPTFSLPSALTFTGKTVTGGTYAGPAFTGLVDNQGAHKDSTQSTPAQITSDQNNYNPSSVVCSTSTTLLINSDAARSITGIAGGAAGCDLFLVNNGSFTISLKDASASSTAGNRFDLGGDFSLLSKSAAHLKYDANASRWRNTTGSGSGGGSGTVTSVTCGTGLSGGTFTTSGTCALALSNTTLQASPGNPTGTSNTTGLMMGLGTTCKLTPAYSGRIRVSFEGTINNNTANKTSSIKVYYGTGTAPANAAAITGTQLGGNPQWDQTSSAFQFGFGGVGGVITGLTPGTAYWFDIALASPVATGTASLTNISCDAFEF